MNRNPNPNQKHKQNEREMRIHRKSIETKSKLKLKQKLKPNDDKRKFTDEFHKVMGAREAQLNHLLGNLLCHYRHWEWLSRTKWTHRQAFNELVQLPYGNQPQKFLCCPFLSPANVANGISISIKSILCVWLVLRLNSIASIIIIIIIHFIINIIIVIIIIIIIIVSLVGQLRMYHSEYIKYTHILTSQKEIVEIDWLNIYSYGSA